MISLVVLFFSACAQKEKFYHGMYEGLKTRERMINFEYDKTISYHEKDIDYKEYKSLREKSDF